MCKAEGAVCPGMKGREQDTPDYSFKGPVKWWEALFLKEMRFLGLKPPGNSSTTAVCDVCVWKVCVGKDNRKTEKTPTDGEAEGGKRRRAFHRSNLDLSLGSRMFLICLVRCRLWNCLTIARHSIGCRCELELMQCTFICCTCARATTWPWVFQLISVVESSCCSGKSFKSPLCTTCPAPNRTYIHQVDSNTASNER